MCQKRPSMCQKRASMCQKRPSMRQEESNLHHPVLSPSVCVCARALSLTGDKQLAKLQK